MNAKYSKSIMTRMTFVYLFLTYNLPYIIVVIFINKYYYGYFSAIGD